MRGIFPHHHSWFPLILVGLTIGLVGVLFVFVTPDVHAPEPVTVVEVITEEIYQQRLASVLDAYEVDGDIEAAYGAILALSVPARLKDEHLALVIEFGQKLLIDEVDEGGGMGNDGSL